MPLDGDTLMRELGLQEGPLLGRALREARLSWEAGEARTVEEALAVARRIVAPEAVAPLLVVAPGRRWESLSRPSPRG